MKGAVVYDSWTGNTRKIAEAIAAENQFDIFSVDQAPVDLCRYDILVLGTPDIKAAPSKAVAGFMERVLPPGNFALFVTFGAPVWGQISSLVCLKKMRDVLSKKGARCRGDFFCPGFHVKFKTYKGRPAEKEIASAKNFARRIMSA